MSEERCYLSLEQDRALLRQERKTLETEIEQEFKAAISIIPPTNDSLAGFEKLLEEDRIKRLKELVQLMKFWDAPNTIPDPKSFLYYAHLQPVLVQMLEDIVQYRDYLERFIDWFGAENEITFPKQNPQSIKKKLFARISNFFCQLIRYFRDWLQTHRSTVVNLRNNEHEVKQNTQSKSKTIKPGAPIHYAVDQLNGDFLDWLLARTNIDVNLRNSFKQTALTLLCERYDQSMRELKKRDEKKDNISEQEKCNNDKEIEKLKAELEKIRTSILPKLLKAKADFNICSINKMLPFELLLKHCEQKETLSFVEQCVQESQHALAIGSINERNERVVRFYNNNPNVQVTMELLEIFLRSNDCINFAKYMASFEVNETNVKKVIRLLLHTACEQKLSDCLRLVLDRGEKHIFKVIQRKPTRIGMNHSKESNAPGTSSVDLNREYSRLESTEVHKGSELEHRVELKGLLKKVCLMADLPLLQHFLKQISDPILLNDDPLLGLTLTKAYNFKHRIEEKNALLACAEYLLNHKLIYKTKQDNFGNTPLHLALNYGFDSIAQVLLQKRYTYLGTYNKNNQTPLDCAKYEFWKDYLDQSMVVETKGSKRIDEMWFNLNGFSPPLQYKSDGTFSSPKQRKKHRSWKMIQPVNKTFTQPQKFPSTVTEMTTLRHIAQSKELERLLLHPVLYTFVMVKWTRLCHWNYLNLLLTALTIVFFGHYSLTACSAEGPSTVLWILSMFGVVFMVIRELLQLLFLRRSYLSFENVLDIVNAIAMGAVLGIGCHGLMSSFVIISLIMELIFLMGSFLTHSRATIIYMFKTVSKKFLQSFLLFMPLIGSFIYAFHLTYNQSPEQQEQVCDKDDCSEDNFNNFRTFWNATVKTLVMTTGEFEAAAIDFEGGKMLLFILFMFFAPIVILNLINGLAVSDIAAIRKESEMISISKKVMLLEQYERGVANVYPAWLKRFIPKPFFSEYQSRIHVKTKEYCKIVVHAKVQPKKQTKGVQISNDPDPDKKNSIKRKVQKRQFSKFPLLLTSKSCNYIIDLRFFRFALFLRLDQSIVDEALATIEKQQAFASTIATKSTPNKTIAVTLEICS